jgi:hypothetical protein
MVDARHAPGFHRSAPSHLLQLGWSGRLAIALALIVLIWSLIATVVG